MDVDDSVDRELRKLDRWGHQQKPQREIQPTPGPHGYFDQPPAQDEPGLGPTPSGHWDQPQAEGPAAHSHGHTPQSFPPTHEQHHSPSGQSHLHSHGHHPPAGQSPPPSPGHPHGQPQYLPSSRPPSQPQTPVRRGGPPQQQSSRPPQRRPEKRRRQARTKKDFFDINRPETYGDDEDDPFEAKYFVAAVRKTVILQLLFTVFVAVPIAGPIMVIMLGPFLAGELGAKRSGSARPVRAGLVAGGIYGTILSVSLFMLLIMNIKGYRFGFYGSLLAVGIPLSCALFCALGSRRNGFKY